MSEPVHALRMSSDEFIARAMQQPKGKRYELFEGEVVAMPPERSAHALLKLRIARRLAEAVEAAGLSCEVYGDGMAVFVDQHTTYEPDATIRCGEPLPGDAVKVLDPVVAVEGTSPSTQSLDAGAKLADYFRVPSVRHYLVARTKDRALIAHTRDEAGTITTRVIRSGAVELDPPGIVVRGLFG
jgi:Uma2 family endonuclease